MNPPPALPLDVTLRVGCSLAYEATGPATLLLNVTPRPARNYAMIFEALSLGDDPPSEQFTDTHGNAVHRVQLRPGINSFRHDAIVAASSQPDNAGLPRVAPESPGELPADLLRYTLPSRYCDSD